MPIETINGVGIFIEETGSGEPLVLVHGSWVDHTTWRFVVPSLAERFRVVVYDRRGHSRSERPSGQGSIREDVADLAAIIERAGGPAHVAGNSMGGSISLRLAAERPELLRTVGVHEPPLFDLLRDDPQTRPVVESLTQFFLAVAEKLAQGDMDGGARMFADTVLGPGAWETMLSDEDRRLVTNNAPTFLDETRDPEILSIDTAALAGFSGPALLSDGSASPPFFAAALGKLSAVMPTAIRKTLDAVGHEPHETHPQEYVEMVTSFIRGAQ